MLELKEGKELEGKVMEGWERKRQQREGNEATLTFTIFKNNVINSSP